MIKQPALPPNGRVLSRRACSAAFLRWPSSRTTAPPAQPERRYRHVLIATDFTATTDGYHREMALLAHALAGTLSLMHFRTDAGSPTPAHDPERDSAEILLDGLTMRLGLRPQIAWITELGDIDEVLAGAARTHGVDLVITGAPASMPELRHCSRIAELAHPLGYHVITRHDEPEPD